MSLKRSPELLAFLQGRISEADQERDAEIAGEFARSSSSRAAQAARQARQLLAAGALPLEEIGAEANRWFGEDAEAREWLESLASALESGEGDADPSDVVVKDSNGTPLAEGDSVTVIKDLKVKGGSSDLKRGTLIKKIHLIGDPENIECRVDGSTLVLKTMFLKKA